MVLIQDKQIKDVSKTYNASVNDLFDGRKYNWKYNKKCSNKMYVNKSLSNKMYFNKFDILTGFLLTTTTLLIAASIYCYLIKYRAKQNIFYHITTPTN